MFINSTWQNYSSTSYFFIQYEQQGAPICHFCTFFMICDQIIKFWDETDAKLKLKQYIFKYFVHPWPVLIQLYVRLKYLQKMMWYSIIKIFMPLKTYISIYFIYFLNAVINKKNKKLLITYSLHNPLTREVKILWFGYIYY